MVSVDFSNSFENKTLILTLMNENFQVQWCAKKKRHLVQKNEPCAKKVNPCAKKKTPVQKK